MVFVNFEQAGDREPLFGLLLDVVPRIGETLHYAFQPSDDDAAGYNSESLAFKRSMHLSDWRVEAVEHHFREFRIGQAGGCTIVCLLSRLPDEP